MTNETAYSFTLAQIRDRIDKGYSAEAAHAAVTGSWQMQDAADVAELYEAALDYQTMTYKLED